METPERQTILNYRPDMPATTAATYGFMATLYLVAAILSGLIACIGATAVALSCVTNFLHEDDNGVAIRPYLLGLAVVCTFGSIVLFRRSRGYWQRRL